MHETSYCINDVVVSLNSKASHDIVLNDTPFPITHVQLSKRLTDTDEANPPEGVFADSKQVDFFIKECPQEPITVTFATEKLHTTNHPITHYQSLFLRTFAVLSAVNTFLHQKTNEKRQRNQSSENTQSIENNSQRHVQTAFLHHT